ncbi:C-type lectin domain family 17, member A-like [Haliotis asinina]|uniref:C-type lectin domain family 17, member A-like n=1 Tax=Haliotis asinina TaxID=109174 RepID=UPI00353222EE
MSPKDGDKETGTEYYSLTAGACSFGYVHNRLLNFCYQLHPDKIFYDDGIANCTSRGEHLVVIDREDKQNHIAKQITSSSRTQTVSYFFDGSDAANERKWIFHYGRPMTYFAWGPGYPKNYSEEDNYVASNKGYKKLL